MAALLFVGPATQLMYYTGLSHAMEKESPWRKPEAAGRVLMMLLPVLIGLLYIWWS